MKDYTIEIDIPDNPNVLLQYYDNIYKMNNTVEALGVTDSETNDFFYYENDNKITQNIQSLYVDGVKYPIVSTLESLFLQDGIFYFNYQKQELYIKFTDEHLKLNKNINVGKTIGFSALGSDCYRNNVPYLKRILRFPSLRQKTDSLAFSVLKYSPSKFSLSNPDGKYDELLSNDLYGQEVRYYKGEENDDYNNYDLIYRGSIQSYTNDYSKIDFTLNDQRKNLAYALPDKMIYTDNFSNMKENNLLPVAYGDIREGVTICTTENDLVVSSHTFYFMDTTHHNATSIDTIYVDGVAVTALSTSLDGGFFTLNKSDCFDGDNLKDVTVKFRGANFDNSIDIIQDLLIVYGGVLYTNDFFNLSEWEEARLNTYEVSLYSKSDRKLIDLIKDITSSNQGVFFQNNRGQYTFRLSDKTRTPSFTIPHYRIKSPKFSVNGSKFYTDVLVNYDKNDSSNTYKKYLNDTQLRELRIKYKTTERKELKTLIKNQSDAISLSNFFLEFSKTQEQIFECTLDLTDEFECNLYDTIKTPYNRNLDNLGLFELLEFQDEIDSQTKKLKLRYIEEA